jgi:hypothetical protein
VRALSAVGTSQCRERNHLDRLVPVVTARFCDSEILCDAPGHRSAERDSWCDQLQKWAAATMDAVLRYG